MATSFATFAQVGVGTTTPVGAFNVDGAADNSATPTTAEQDNDFVVLANGNLGIGTTAPTTALEIYADAGMKRLTLTNVTNGTGGTNAILTTDGGLTLTRPTDASAGNVSGYIDFRGDSGGTFNRMFYNQAINSLTLNGGSNANVGIGTIAPLYALHIEGSSNNVFHVDKGDEGTFGEGANSTFNIQQGTGNSGGQRGLSVHGNGTNTAHSLVDFYSHDGTNFRLGFSQDNSKGLVGIGTNSPTAKLEVAGAIKVGLNVEAAVNGMIRYNTIANRFQGFAGGVWVNLH